jgi:hypothetical protein
LKIVIKRLALSELVSSRRFCFDFIVEDLRQCVYRAELDMGTLVWTRGCAFPFSWFALPQVRLVRNRYRVHSAK